VIFSVVGPTYPYRGGIAHHTTLLVRHLRERHQVKFYSFQSQYPRWLFPGRTDRDPSKVPLQETCEYLLSPLDPISWLRTAARVRADRPDALIMPWWVPFWAPAWAAVARLSRVRRSKAVIFVCHNVLPHERRWWDRPLARAALASGTGFIVHSQQDERDLKALLPKARVCVAPLPTYRVPGNTTMSPPSAREAMGIPADQRTLLFFGFVRPYKGLDILLDALPIIRQQVPVHLLIVGEMWNDRERYVDQIEHLGMTPHVTVVDRYVANEELEGFFVAADVVVLPYRSATQSAVVQLAFGFGKPVITTNVGGLAEAVTDGVNGLMVQPGDSTALARSIVAYFQQNLGPALTAGVKRQSDSSAWETLLAAVEELVSLQPC
jgi:glycosyltransferase involved in cell wall biosynthesis